MTPPSRLRVTSIRYADAADLPLLAGIEEAADARFAEVSAALGIDHERFPAGAPSGRERAAEPGFLLVVGAPVVGFAHVLDIEGHAVVEQLSVRPEAGGQGLGTGLLRAAMGVAMQRGYGSLHLRTFAEVAWNAPFYARHGFEEVADPAWIAPLVAAEKRVELTRWGRRVTMARPLVDEPAPVPAVSVIPLRDGPHGVEAFVQFRVGTMDFAANAAVFPGGRIDPVDFATRTEVAEEVLHRHALRWAQTGAAALRGHPRNSAALLLATGVREVAEEASARVDPGTLVPWDNWITPIDCPKRFDVYFFVVAVPAGEEGRWRHTTSEAHDSRWVPLTDLARSAEAGEVLLLPPTRTIVDELLTFADVEAILAARPQIVPVRHDLEVRRPRPTA